LHRKKKAPPNNTGSPSKKQNRQRTVALPLESGACFEHGHLILAIPPLPTCPRSGMSQSVGRVSMQDLLGRAKKESLDERDFSYEVI
jgi:hypothetical protein